MNEHIEQAITNLRANTGRYAKPERYYDGRHDLAFATEKFQTAFGTLFREFALNLCPVVCDAMRDKLKITGFSVEESAGNQTAQAAGSARRIWAANRMALRAGEVHKEALKTGDAYVIVWPDAAGEPAIYPNRAMTCTVAYSDEEPGRALWAAKYWRSADKRTRLNLFYPDRIEKYITRTRSEAGLPDVKAFDIFREGGADDGVVANPYGIVPVFHFANNADTGSSGRSEMEAAIPIQDGLNKSVLDMLVAMEFSAFRQRWVAGIEAEIDEATGKPKEPFVAGVERLWMTGSPDARFGDFQSADLEQFLKVKDGFRMDIASVTGTPLHYLMQTTKGVPSGESIRKAETRFLAKVRDRQEAFGQVWADVMSLAVGVSGRRGVRFLTHWEDPAPVSERELLENILMKKEIGIPVVQALKEAGYGDEFIREMKAKED